MQYDAIVIGAGMSGLAAGIRLAMFDKKVCIFEKHTISGGLNSYYQRRNQQKGGIRQFDVGLHALTNFAVKGSRGKPLTKLLKQLRLSYDDLKLQQQTFSSIHFQDTKLKFSNDFEMLKSEIAEKFPSQIDGFNKLVHFVESYNEVSLAHQYSPTRSRLGEFISEPLLIEMLMCPLLIYGSAWEHDMDFSQFVVMFKSIFMEGFSRPENGVRTIIDLLLEKYQSLGGELRFRDPVESIHTQNGEIVGVTTKKLGRVGCNKIFSSMGLPETMAIVDETTMLLEPAVGQMSFMETILVLDKKISRKDFAETIVFYNKGNEYRYRKSSELFDENSAVICCPDNYGVENPEGEGTLRITFIANYDKWKALERSRYLEEKAIVYEQSLNLIRKLIPDLNSEILFHDVFSPTTVERYTSHFKGTVYGSTDKSRDGSTPINGLYIIGTDQGFLGIVGAMLSGISISNLYGLMEQS